jgi:tetratricopeptide (TPR) repeat protein
LLVAGTLRPGGASAASADMDWARENWKAGRYADAAARLQAVLDGADEAARPEARRLLARLRLLTGAYDEAAALFADTANPTVDELILIGRARVARGRLKEAEEAFTRAYEESGQASAVARAELIDIWDAGGRREEAELARTWFFKTYQKISKIRYGRAPAGGGEAVEVTDPAELIALARAMERRDPQGAINALTVAQQKDPGDPEPYLRSFYLFSEKYAWSDAPKELAAAAKIAPRHPEVQLCVAYHKWAREQDAEAAEAALNQALEVNPNLVPARTIKASLHIFDDEYEEARRELDAALKINPADLQALSVLAAWHYETGDADAFARACAHVLELNPLYAELYNTIAESCERRRQFPQAQAFYHKATELDPGNWRGYYGAGMALARRGEDADGKKMLEKAFELNKFNIFARNMLQVLDKLVPPEGKEGQFESLKTAHFTIWAPKKDAAFLLPYYALCLEEHYARLAAKYSFEPEKPVIVEVFSDHQHFSARTTGLPQIGADGACFGRLITLDSPRVWQAKSVPQFNWAVVAQHELTHVFSLQMTEYRIPRWLTEGMSVFEEDSPRLDLDPLFASAARNGRLIKIADLNRQMTRPTARANPLLAYYQAGCIVGHIFQKHGAEGMGRLLAACRKSGKLPEVIKEGLGLPLEEFESAALAHQLDFSRSMVRLEGAPDQATMTRLRLEVKESPDDPEKLAALAGAFLALPKPDFDSAVKHAGEAVAKGDKGPGVARAYAVLGMVAFEKDRKYREARAHFEKALAADPDSAVAHLYLGVCLSREGRAKEALERLLRARELSPRHIGKVNAYEELYTVYRDLGEEEKALEALRARVAIDKAGFDQALRLSRLALGRRSWELAAWAAYRAITIDPFRPEPHDVWAQAADGLKDTVTAEREWRLAVLADPAAADYRVGLARNLLAQGRRADALQAAEEARAIEPDRPDIVRLIKEIGPVSGAQAAPDPKSAPRPADDVLKRPADDIFEKPAPRGQAPAPVRELEKIDA